VNTAKLEPFLFRNYALPLDGRQSSYAGASKYKLWQALQASAAAPGYFDEVHLDGLVHQVG
jgi:patatin-like phospholipase/acyl hydrolase